MIACRANIESKEVLFASLCITTSSKSSDLQLKHVARSIRTMKYAERLYIEESARQLILQLLVLYVISCIFVRIIVDDDEKNFFNNMSAFLIESVFDNMSE